MSEVMFKSQFISGKFVFKSGKVANFSEFLYATSNKKEIEELREEIENGNQFFSEVAEIPEVPVAHNEDRDFGHYESKSGGGGPKVGILSSRGATAISVKSNSGK